MYVGQPITKDHSFTKSAVNYNRRNIVTAGDPTTQSKDLYGNSFIFSKGPEHGNDIKIRGFTASQIR